MVRRQRHKVLLVQTLPIQLAYQLPGVGRRHLEHRKAPHVGKERVLHGGGQLLQPRQALGGQDEAGPELAKLTQHRLVVHAGHGLHLVHHHQRPAPLVRGEPSLLPDHRVRQVQQRRPHQGRHVRPRRGLGGGDQQHAALGDHLPEVQGGAALSQDGPGFFDDA